MAKRHKPEEIIAKLRQVEVMTGQGTSMADAIRSIGVTEVTYYRRARLGHTEQLAALKRLDQQARLLEQNVTGPSFEAYVAGERARSPSLDGRSVFGWEQDAAAASAATARQGRRAPV